MIQAPSSQADLSVDVGVSAGTQRSVVFTVAELATLLRMDRKTVYAALKKGTIPGGKKVGRCLRISRDAVIRWLSSQGPAAPSKE